MNKWKQAINYISLCNNTWANSSNVDIFVKERKVTRLGTNSLYRHHSDPLFAKLYSTRW